MIESSARVTANGATSGGEVLVGGSWQNSDPTVYQATTTTVQTGARLEASATGNGDGGTVVVWSDLSEERGYTFVQGTLKAEGGIDGGDGGRIETSGAYLNVSGIDLSASSPHGAGESGCSTPITSPLIMGERRPQEPPRSQTMNPLQPAPLTVMTSKPNWMSEPA